MKTYLFEAHGAINWGKFLVGRYEEEWEWPSNAFPMERSVLHACGVDYRMLWILDIQTREGAMFKPGGDAHADLRKHRIWVCPMFEPWLEWFYEQDLTDLDKVPSVVSIPDLEHVALSGYRRPGTGSDR
jgi:hypothetical protein